MLKSNEFNFIKGLKKINNLAIFLDKMKLFEKKRGTCDKSHAMKKLNENYEPNLEKQILIANKNISSHNLTEFISYFKYPLIIYILGSLLLSNDEVKNIFPSKFFFKSSAYFDPILYFYVVSLITLIYIIISVKKAKIQTRDSAINYLKSAKMRKNLNLTLKTEEIVHLDVKDSPKDDKYIDFLNGETIDTSTHLDSARKREEEEILLNNNNENNNFEDKNTVENVDCNTPELSYEDLLLQKEKKKKRKKNKNHF